MTGIYRDKQRKEGASRESETGMQADLRENDEAGVEPPLWREDILGKAMRGIASS